MFKFIIRRPIVAASLVLLGLVSIASLSATPPSQAADETTVTPDANESLATAQRSADEAMSLYWAASARLADKEGDPFTALALALEANKIPSPPDQAVRALEDIAYAPGPRKILAKNPDADTWVAAYSPDGKSIAAADATDQLVYLFDAASGQEIRHFEGHQFDVSGVGFSPDGTKIISSSTINSCGDLCLMALSGGELILWDVKSGQQLWHLNDDSSTGYYEPIFNPDGNSILMRNEGLNELVEVSVKDGSEIHLFEDTSNYSHLSQSLFNPDGRQILSVSDHKSLILWDAKTKNEIKRFDDVFQTVSQAIFSPDGKSILVSDAFGQIELLDIETGEVKLHPYLRDNAGSVLNMAFRPNGEQFLASTSMGKITLWDATTGELVKSVRGSISNLAFSPDTHTFLSASNRNLALWDVEPGQEIRRFDRQLGHIEQVAFSSDGKIVASMTGNQELILWNTATGEIIHQLVEFDKYANIPSFSFSPDGNTIASIRWPDLIQLWDVQSGKQIRTIKTPVYHVVFSPDGRSLLSGHNNDEIILWDINTGEEIQRFVNGDTKTDLQSLEFSPDGRHLLTVDTRYKAILWDVATGKMLRHLPDGYTAIFSPDGLTILYQDRSNNDLVFSDAVTGEESNHINYDNFGRSFYPIRIAFSGDGHHLLINGNGGLFVWDISTGQVLRSFGRYGLPAVFSPDGRMILTSDPDIYGALGYPSSGGTSLVLLRIDSPDELIQWTLANRAVATLTCDQRAYYRITPICDELGTLTMTSTPSHTATATLLPSTATPTSNLATQTAQAVTDDAYWAATQTSSLLTATVVTYTPTMTPT